MNYKRDYILQRRPIISRSLLIVATPYDLFICAYVSFADYRLFYRSFLQKRPIILTIRMGYLTHSYVTWTLAYCAARDVTHSNLRHDLFLCATWLINMFDITHLYIRMCDIYICMCDMTRYLRGCDMTHSYVRHDTFIRATWLIHMCNMTHSLCDMTYSDRHATDSCMFVCAYVCMHICMYILHCLIPNSRGDLRSRCPIHTFIFYIHTNRTAGTKRQQWQLIDNNTDDFITSWQTRSQFPIINFSKKKKEESSTDHEATMTTPR